MCVCVLECKSVCVKKKDNVLVSVEEGGAQRNEAGLGERLLGAQA